MPVLIRTPHEGRVVWLGHVPDRDAALASTASDALALTLDGPEGEDHGGATRPSCSRVSNVYPKGTEIRNARQISVLCARELARIAAKLELPSLDPAWLGATMVLEGIPDLSHLPPASRLQIGAGAATVVVDLNNRPCHLPVPVIGAATGGGGRAFKTAAQGLRGFVGWVERAGPVRVGDAVSLFVPDQRAWAG